MRESCACAEQRWHDDRMTINMNRIPAPNTLSVFEASARHLSFTKAGAELNLTQAAVSKQIIQLEERLIEQVFSWSGVGWLTVQAVFDRDYPLVQTSVLFIAVGLTLVNLVVDLGYGLLNPKLRVQ